MAKQLNVNLAFTADTSKAKGAIQELQQTLSKIAYDGSKGISPDMASAAQSAKELQIHLNNAFNAKTGKFDLSMLDKSLSTSKTKITDLATGLLKAGSSGQQAFLQLAQAISAADQPMLRINSKLKEFGTTMANTVRWQLSSSLLHGFMGGLQSAYGYAQDLNRSLTDIRIVTGASSDEMALFAERANKAAKTLSTTTTDYTKASLIYFQQGLSDAEVEERTNVTIKMANAAGVSAQVVSDQMTAVWNNFDDGSKSLEYYADVMTALGAATASSTDEIADGLQKFAAVADTVGLSYEYATAALATVTAETRESADVVGTAFKTLFARIQGLSLGETLEDGVDLNKYSKALSAIGVSVLDANGNIREMDSILDDLGAKWNTLTDAEKQATAQTVAGVRQYTQLMALMENWDVFQSNLGVVKGAEGTLTEQAKIYEESWAAASKRVKASAEGIYQSLLDDKFFISLNNGFANLLTGIDAFIDGFGGVKSLLISIGSIFMSSFAGKIPQVLSDLSYNIKLVTKGTSEAYKNIQTQMNEATQKAFTDFNIKPDSSIGTAIQSANDLTAARSKLALVSDKMSNSERQMAEMTLSHIQTQQQELVTLKQKNEALQDSISATTDYMKSGSGTHWDDSMDQTSKARANNFAEKATNGLGENVFNTEVLQNELSNLDDFATNITRNINDKIVTALSSPETRTAALQLTDTFKEMQTVLDTGIKWDSFKNGETDINNVKSQIRSFIELIPEGAREALGLNKILGEMDEVSDFDALREKVKQLSEALKDPTIASEKLIGSLKGIGKGSDVAQLSQYISQYTKNAKQAEQQTTALQNILNSFSPGHIVRTSEALGALGGLAGNVYSVVRSFVSVIDSLSNPDLSGWEKFGSVLMGVSMIIPGVISGIKNFGTMVAWAAGATTAQAIASNTVGAALTKEQAARAANIIMTAKQNGETQESIIAKLAEYLASIKVAEGDAAVAMAAGLAAAGMNVQTGSALGLTKALLSLKVSIFGVEMALGTMLAGLLAVVAVAAILVVIANQLAKNRPLTLTEQLANAQETAEGLRNSLEETTQAAENLKATFDGYDSAVQKLQDCVYGTQEWRDALQAVNQEALTLLGLSPELATMRNENGESGITYGSHGETIVADWAKEQLLQESNERVLNAQLASTIGEQKVRDLENQISRENARNRLLRADIDATAKITAEQAERELGYLERQNAIVMPPNSQSGAQASKAQEQPTVLVNRSDEVAKYIMDHAEDYLNDPETFETNLRAFVSSNGITTDVDAWMKELSSGTFGDWVASIDNNTAAVRAENRLLAQQLLLDQQAVQDSEYTDEIIKIVSTDLDQRVATQVEQLKNDNWGISNTEGLDLATRDAFNEYLEATGLSGDLTGSEGTGTDRVFIYLDSEGNEKKVSWNTMAQTYAASTVHAETEEQANQLAAAFEGATEQRVARLTATATGDINDLLVSDANYSGSATTTAIAQAGWITEDQLRAIGYEGTGDEMRAAFATDYAQILVDAKQGLTNIMESFSDTVTTEMEGLNLSQLTLGEVDTLGKTMQQAFNTAGSEGMEAVSTMFDKAAAEGMGDEFVSALSNIDWSTATPESLTAALEAAGVTTEYTTGELNNFINVMGNAGTTVAQATSRYAELHGIIDGLKTGDTIQELDFKKLGPGAEDFFVLMADGTYKLVADAQLFYDFMNEQSISQHRNNYRLAKEEVEIFEGIEAQDGVAGLQRVGNFQESDYLNAQLDYLQEMGYNPQQIAEWRNSVGSDSMNQYLANIIADAVQTRTDSAGGVNAAQDIIDNKADVAEDNYQQTGGVYATTAANTTELDQMVSQDGLHQEAYTDGILALASGYNECSDELAAYNKAVAEYGEGTEEATEAQEDLVKALKEAEWRKIAKNIKSYMDELSETKDLDRIGEIYVELADTINETFGTSVDAEWVKNNLDLLEEWSKATGKEAQEAAYKVKQSAITSTLEAQDILSENNTVEFDIDGDGALDSVTAIGDRWSAMKSIIEANPIGIDANGRADLTGLVSALMQAGFTAQEVAAYLAAIGETEVTLSGSGSDIVPPGDVDLTTEEGQQKFADFLNSITSWDGDVSVAGGQVPSVDSVDMTNLGSGSGGGGGGGGSSKPAEKKKKTDVVDRYKEVTDQLDKVAHNMGEAESAAEGLYGKARLKAMERVNQLLQKEIQLLGKKRQEAKQYLELDRSDLASAASEAGISFEFNEDGSISNYTEALTRLYDEYNALVDSYNSDGEISEEEQEALDALDEKINKVKEAVEQYDETRALLFELDQEEIDKFNEQLSNNFENFQMHLELDIEFNEMDLEYLDYLLGELEDDVYKRVESLSLMQDQFEIYLKNLERYETAFTDLEEVYADGSVLTSDYADGMKEISSAILENLENIQEMDKAMKEYYGETISMAQDEISLYTDLMDGAASALEHYTSLLELFGRSMDYDSMLVVLQAQADTAKDAYEASYASYEMFKSQAEARKTEYEKAQADGLSDIQLDAYKQRWLDAEQAASDAQEEMLSDAETWAENMRAILETSLSKFANELEDALTLNLEGNLANIGSFDELITRLERAQSLQEEFLTDTNKIYETNKLMRTAQKELDKTTNSYAKRKLESFINETNALQQQGKLSQYELEIQQAKYDLLLAEIALKEAQNAKSTVRLQKDSEGNFGYVYTADQGAIADAQQKFEDAQNNMYNKGLEGANNYAQKYVQTMQEMNDALAEIQQKYYNEEYESEAEYEAAMENARQYYYEQLQNYSYLHSTALSADSRVAADAWSRDFASMTTSTELWMSNVDIYMGNVRGAFSQWKTSLEGLEGQTIGKKLDELASKTKNITDKTDALRLMLTKEDGVINALGLELTAVNNVTLAYYAQRDALDEVIERYKTLARESQEKAKDAGENEFDIAPGSQVTVKANASSWIQGEGYDNSGSLLAGTGYTVLRWDTGKSKILISNGAGSYGWVNKSDLVGFDTGGYTGSWGPDGKMALLHEKELVLNASDTENLLTSMEFLSRVIEVIDLQALNNQLGAGLNIPNISNNESQKLEQQVHIEASFPNAVNHSEIELAFNDLINISSQYANRK